MRPLLVLLLVLAALAALIFGVLSFLGDPPPKQPEPVPTTTRKTEPAGTNPSLLEGVPSEVDRSVTTTEPEGDRTSATTEAGSFQYENSLTGVVLNPEGQPVAACEVGLTTYVELVFVGEPVDTTQDRATRTDGEGRFVFTHLEPRQSYRLSFKHKDYAFKEIESVPVGETGVSEEPPVRLSSGAVLQGYVKDEGGNNVDGATLVLDGLVYQGAPYDPPDRMITKTDNRGWYEFKNVSPGQRMLSLTAPGYGTVSLNSLVFTKDEVVSKDFTLQIGEMIRGRVVHLGQGVPDARVQAFSIANTSGISRGEAMTDAMGEFTLENLTPGEYNVLAGAKGYRSGHTPRQKTGSDNVIIELAKNADVCGRVIDGQSGAPVASFTCRLRTNNGPGVATSLTEYVENFNDPSGEFCMTGIPQGSFVIEASAPGFAPSFSAPVTVTVGQNPPPSTVRLTKGGTISGRIVDGAGKPVARARITTHDKEWMDDDFNKMLGDSYPSDVTQVDVRCGEDGRFSLKGMRPEVYQMNIRAPGFTRWVRTDIVVSEGQVTDLGDIKLASGGTIRGTLLDAAGLPLVGGSIHVVADDGREGIGYTTKSGAGGKFLIMNVSPGQYVISAARMIEPDGTPFDRFQDTKNSQKSLTVVDGTTNTVELALSP